MSDMTVTLLQPKADYPIFILYTNSLILTQDGPRLHATMYVDAIAHTVYLK